MYQTPVGAQLMISKNFHLKNRTYCMVGQTLVPLKNREKHTHNSILLLPYLSLTITRNQLKYFLPSNNNNKTIFLPPTKRMTRGNYSVLFFSKNKFHFLTFEKNSCRANSNLKKKPAKLIIAFKKNSSTGILPPGTVNFAYRV